jgi:restriction system protein
MIEDTYEELMLPLFLRLGGSAEQVLMDDSPQPLRHGLEKPMFSASAEEAVNVLAAAHRSASRALEDEVMAHLYAQSPAFFEGMIIDLLLAMGFGNRRRDLARQLGRSHDGGVDGIVSQDALGLDIILLQAKRLKPSSCISASQIRDFIGSLETRKATKGVFFTTGTFSAFAKSAAAAVPHRVRLIGGRELSALMVRHGIGVTTAQSFVFKTLDHSYFKRQPKHAGGAISSDKQPSQINSAGT